MPTNEIVVDSVAVLFAFTDDMDFQKKESDDVPRLPPQFDIELFLGVISMLLTSEHFQVVLKTLAFIYNHESYFHGHLRVKLFEGLLLRTHFNRLFMHWMYEVRRFYHNIVVYKMFRTSRLWLPCKEDQKLVRKAEAEEDRDSNSLTRGYRGTMRAFSMLQRSREKTQAASSGFFGSLVDAVFNPGRAQADYEKARSAFFEESLEEEEKAVDLLMASKLDSFVHCVVAQSKDSKLNFFDQRHQPYASRAAHEYTVLLRQYYAIAWKEPGQTVRAPELFFQMLDGK